MPVYFHSEYVDFNLKPKLKYKNWLKNVIISEGKKPGEINIIFVNDERLLKINIEYLHHNYFTDIISFDYSEQNLVSGDIFISIDRVKENAGKFEKSFLNELNRVIVHGVLHLLKYKDSTDEEKKQMRRMEDKYLDLFME